MTDRISGYFDHNATTPMSEAALRAWTAAAREHWHNPSGLYHGAAAAKRTLEEARESLADLLGVDEPERIVFTSGATEANNAVVRHFAEQVPGRLLFSGLEHPSVAAAVEKWIAPDRRIELPVDPGTGAVEVGIVEEHLKRGGVGAVCLMAANNESGVLQPWREVAELCRDARVACLVDAAQWIGKLTWDDPGGLFFTGSAHKFGGGKGGGFLVLPEGETFFQGLRGGPQESGHRAGTENLPAVVAMIAALEERENCDGISAGDQARYRDDFEAWLVEALGIHPIGAGGDRLWNTSFFVLPHGRNLKWLARLSQRGFAVSTGSACSAGKGQPSTVLAAMGLDWESMGRVLRVSGGPATSEAEWKALAQALVEVEVELRGQD